ncbi:MAG: hypothetical protein ACI4HL_00845, partial [Ruminococcus sp.]
VTVLFKSNDYDLTYEDAGSGSYNVILNCEKVYITPHDYDVEFYLIIDKQGYVQDIIIDDSLSGSQSSYSVDIDKSVYVPKNDDVLLISADNGTNNYGLSSSSGSAVSVGSAGGVPSGDSIPTWTVADVSDSGSFKLLDSATGQYLSITSDALSLGDTGTNFYAVTKYEESGSDTPTDLNGVMLYSLENNMFVNFDSENQKFTLSSTYDESNTYHIYLQKTSTDVDEGGWGIKTGEDATPETEFYYKKSGVTGKQQLSSSEYFLTSDIVNNPTYHKNESVETYPNFIVAVNNLKEDGYYESDEITVRIWGEGYDREAQTPVQGGRMKIDFHFFAVEEE